jgi:hypothetical protein
MKNIKDYVQFNEQAINSLNWKETFDEVECSEFDLSPGDEFVMKTGKAKYSYDETPTRTVFYRGCKDNDLIYFSYELDGTVYRIPMDELETKIVRDGRKI